MMRRTVALISAVLLSCTVHAQYSYTAEQIMSNYDFLSNTLCPYPDTVAVQTPAPRGYKPFHIIHIGRHGSRYLSSPKDYSEVVDLLSEACSASELTPEGLSLLHDVMAVAAAAEGHAGMLTSLGRDEHRRIIDTMCDEFPEVFAPRGGKCTVDVYNSFLPRVIESRDAAMERLVSRVPAIMICNRTDDEFVEKYFSHHNLSTSQKMFWDRRSDFSSSVDPGRFSSAVFKHEGYMSHDSACEFMAKLWRLAAGARLQDGSPDLYRYFTAEELFGLWKRRCSFIYSIQGPHPDGFKYCGRDIAPLVERIIACGDSAIKGRAAGPAVEFHFCHDTQTTPLSMMLGFEDSNRIVQDYDRIQEWYCDFNVAPMAANIQLVMFRRNHGRKVLVKILQNGREIRLTGLDAACWPYYRWGELKPYFQARADRVREQ